MPDLVGNSDPNTIDGSTNGTADNIYGNEGADILTGGAGDTLYGGADNDVLYVTSGSETAHGNDGIDRLFLDWWAASAGLATNYGPGQDGTSYYGNYVSGDHFVSYDGIENLNADLSGFDDNLVMIGYGTIRLNGGNDFISVGAGNALDDIDGGIGVDGISVDLSFSSVNLSWDITAAGAVNSNTADVGTYRNFDYFGTLVTGAGNDTIVTSLANDTNEIVVTGGGNDTVTVTDGNDRATMGTGTDRLILDWDDATASVYTNYGPGFDSSVGFYGTWLVAGDRQVEYSGVENFTVLGGSGNDSLVGIGDDVLHGNGGDDFINSGTGSAGDEIDGGTGTNGLSADLSAAVAAVSFNAVTNSFTNEAAMGSYHNFGYFGTLSTGGGNDTIVTSQANDTNEVINTNGGDDTVTVTDGNDKVALGTGTDRLVLDWDDATTSVYTNYGPGYDSAVGFYGTWLASGDRQVEYTGADSFSITSGSGDDSLIGIGIDTLYSGAGNDFINVGTGTAGDDVDGGTGRDGISVDMSAQTASVSWDITVAGNENSNTAAVGSYKNFEYFGTLVTGSGNDTIVTSLANDVNESITTNDGNDSVTVTDGSDTVAMGTGNDRLVLNWGDVTTAVYTNYGPNYDSAVGWYGTWLAENDRQVGYTGVDNFTITTGSANDTLAGIGDDVFKTAGGDDFISGGTGSAGDNMDGGSGTDGISMDMSAATGDISWNLVANSFSGTGVGTYTNFEYFGTLSTGSGNDTIVTSALDGKGETIRTYGGDDSVTVTDGADSVDLGAGNDRLVMNWGAATGNVYISYGIYSDGPNTVFGAFSIDGDRSVSFSGLENLTATLGSGDDRIEAFGDAVIDTGAGNDFVYGDAGSAGDNMNGGAGTDGISIDMSASSANIAWNVVTNSFSGIGLGSFTNFEYFGDLRTGSGNDTIVTSAANDTSETVRTNGGDDTVTVTDGDDVVELGAGNDRLVMDWGSATGNVYISYGIYADGPGTVYGAFRIDGDRAVSFSGLENLTATLGSGNDTIEAFGDAVINTGGGNDFVYGDAGSAGDNMNGGAGIDGISVDMSAATTAVAWNVNTNSFSGPAATGTYTNFEYFGTLVTGSGDDAIVTSNLDGKSETINTGGGNDIVTVFDGGDTVTMGAGQNDRLVIDWRTTTENVSVTYGFYGEGGGTYFGGYSAGGDRSVTFYNTEALTVMSGSGTDSLYGLDANDVLNGGTGADTMTGGLGDDSYFVDNVGDVVNENADAGTDTINSSIAWSLAINPEVENLTLIGSANIGGTGNAKNNVITGNGGNNTLNGGLGADTLAGGAGNDIYVVDDLGDTVTEGLNAGTDLVQSAVSLILGDNIENLTLTGSSAIDGRGNALANTMTGNGAANQLDGGLGADTMSGGNGNDIYIVDNAGDVVTETSAGGGTDSVRSSVSFTLGANLENLSLGGSANIDATGNGLANVLAGNGGNNRIDGGAGADTMSGGLGDDVFVVDVAGDTVTENAGEGTDTVESAVSFTLGANLENLTLTGAAATNGTGNALANTILGNGAANTLDGGAGADTLRGGAGDDIYIVDDAGDTVTENAGEGTDTVRSAVAFALGANLENLILTGTASVAGTGNELANQLTGNSGANRLDGGLGADTMAGGAGNDTYVVDNAADTVTESLNAGIDTVETALAYTLGDNVENLLLTGLGNVNGTGNALANAITGNAGANTLDGGLGADALAGGAGNDVYIVDNAGDTVTESANAGTDLVQSSVSFTLGANVERLVLTGAAAIDGTGNTLANMLTGNGAANRLDGGAGADTMTGGLGDDTYVVDSASDVVVELAGEGTDTVEASITYTLAGTFLENLRLTGAADLSATGNALANNLYGNAGANTLNGGLGADHMEGGAGNDRYLVDDAGDTVVEAAGAGNDSVLSAVSYVLGDNLEYLTLTGSAAINGTGNALANILTGNSNVNFLDGGAGADTMKGGKGDDTYFVDNAGDVVAELDGEGSDTINATVSFSLAGQYAEVLNLLGSAAINGTGNSLNNRIVGNSASNILIGGAGNDRLDGGAGADKLVGGIGNDTYVIDNASDLIVENNGEGIDTVEASISYSIAGQYIETLTLTGIANINATGNGQANTLNGNAGNNTLNGGGGADTMTGGNGDDRYIVDDIGDKVFETSATGGTDTVESSVTFSIAGQYIETLTLTGSAAINATGSSQANTINGNSAANVLNGAAGNDALHGGLGSDTLTGGAGLDTYWFETALGASNVDNITDFSVADDTIYLDRTIFAGITADGALNTAAFWQGTAAHDADDRIVYDKATGNLYYDADGTGAGTAVLFAHVAANTALTAADFFAVP